MAECPISKEVNRISENLIAVLNHELTKPQVSRGHIVEALLDALEMVLRQLGESAVEDGAVEPREVVILRASMSLMADKLHEEMHEDLGIGVEEGAHG